MRRYLKGILGTACSVGMMLSMTCAAYADVPFIAGGTASNEVYMVEANNIVLPTLDVEAIEEASAQVSTKKKNKVIDRTAETVAAEEAAMSAADKAAEAEEAAASEKETAVSMEAVKALEVAGASTNLRSKVVDYALSFVGGRYVYGGTDPHTGADCSGFTRYILQNAAGISLPHSSGGQSSYGVAISSAQMQPGDLLFYGGSTSSINHVAMYIGSGKIVHASTAKTGIKVSNWNYRNPVKIISVLG